MIVCKPKSALINALFVLSAGGLGIWLYLILTFDLHSNFWLQLVGIWLALFVSVLVAVIALRKYFILRADHLGIELEHLLPKRRTEKLRWSALQSWQETGAGRKDAYRLLELNFGNRRVQIANLEHTNYTDLLTWLQKNASNKRR